VSVFLRMHEVQNAAKAKGGRLLRVLFLWIGRLSPDPRAARLLSLVSCTFSRSLEQMIIDNKATTSVTPTMLLRACGPNANNPGANNPRTTAPRRNMGPEI
jgi:hypothetical protein